MDAIDRKIIELLVEDARVPLAQVAKAVGIATATVHQRYRRLVDRGIIRGAHLDVDWEALGLPVVALVSLSLGTDPRPFAAVADEVAAIPYVQSCYAVTGEFDLLLTVRAHSSSHLGEILERVRGVVPGPSRTVIVLSTYFEGRIPPLEEETA